MCLFQAELVNVITVFNELVCKPLQYGFKKNERCFSVKTKLNIEKMFSTGPLSKIAIELCVNHKDQDRVWK